MFWVYFKKTIFELLDERFYPTGQQQPRIKCVHSYANTVEILTAFGMDSEEIEEILSVMRFNGGCCDCEILYNIAEQSRLKSEYWKACHRELTAGN